MEEEGIYYYFEHGPESHRLVLADRSPDSPELPHEPRAIFHSLPGGPSPGPRIERWEKFQELRPARFPLRDHSFQPPRHPLDATGEAAAPANHEPAAETLRQPEVFEYPGDYAHRFDSIGPEGETREKALEAVFDLNRHTAQLRLQEQQALAVQI